MRRIGIGLTMLLVSAPSVAYQCYELINARGQTIYKSGVPPFSLAWPGAASPELLASRRRGDHLIIHNNRCNLPVSRNQAVAPTPFGLSVPSESSASVAEPESSYGTEYHPEPDEPKKPKEPRRPPPPSGPPPTENPRPAEREARRSPTIESPSTPARHEERPSPPHESAPPAPPTPRPTPPPPPPPPKRPPPPPGQDGATPQGQ